jgi:hypothetical protein
VQQHDVRRRHARGELLARGGGDPLVDAALGLAERPAVARVAVQPVVNALGEVEEVRLAVHHDPAGVDSGALRVADQRAQHLGDAAAECGRVDVPEDTTAQQLVPAGERLTECIHPVGGEDLAEAFRREWGDGDVV